jgi:hypothetical protein
MSNGKDEVLNPCEQCEYYFGKEAIHCSVHPYGKESEYCSDWQRRPISLQEKNLMNNELRAKSFFYKKSVAITLNIAFIVLCGYGLYQGIKLIKNDSEKYNKYNQECKIFLEKAGYAGTIGVAQDELEVAVNWLKINYSTQTFEYKDLEANLAYLKKQPKEGIVPTAIKDSIKQNSIFIEKEKDRGLSAQSFIFKYIPTVIMALLLILGLSSLFVLFEENILDE